MKRTLNLILLLTLLNLPLQAALYIVGSATPYLWNRQAMTEISSGTYQWQGYLTHGGELKFMISADGWGAHWGPSIAFSTLSYGTSPVALHSSGDYKYYIDAEGYATITVDTRQRQITLTHQDGTLPYRPTYPEHLYPIGSAIMPQSSFALEQQGEDTGIYTGQFSLIPGTLTFHSRPYHINSTAREVEPKLSSDATATKKKLALAISTDLCAYQPGAQVSLTANGILPANARVRYRHLGDVIADMPLTSRTWTWTAPYDDFQGYMVEVYTPEESTDIILGTIAIDVSSDWTHFPRYGFVASFGNDKGISTVLQEMTWLNRCHINAVQFQDWHNNHDWPLGGTRDQLLTTYKDIANRTIYTSSIRNYISRQHKFGMKSFFYNLCFGALNGYEERGVKAEWMAYTDKQHKNIDKHKLPDTWKSDIYLTNPANTHWQQYLADRNDDVYANFDFDGYQIDQLGPRNTLYDYSGKTIDLPSAYASFIQAMKSRHPEKRLVMNAVSRYGASEMASTGKLDCFYNEVWGCHDYDALTASDARFTHLKTIIDENRNHNASLQTILAAYMNYCRDNAYFNIPGIIMTDAVIFALGGSHLELGGDHNLCREYFPYSGMKMGTDLQDWLTHYYDFATAYENLLRGRWNENSQINVSSSAVSINTWQPVNGQVTQLARDVEGRHVIHLLNFNCQENTKITDPAYLLCWHDRDGLRPWPVEYNQMPISISGIKADTPIRRIWVASPDYMGGAVQEITDYTYSAGTLQFTLPALQYWTMIVIEPEDTSTSDDIAYGPLSDTQSVLLNEPSELQQLDPADSPYATFQLPWTGTYDARIDLQAGTLTISGDEPTGICIPFAHTASGTLPWGYTLSGTQAVPGTRGVVIKQGRKVMRK